jgi:hypothetical protein
MRRIWIVLVSAGLVAAWGCGGSYNERLTKTLDDMRYRKRLDDMLMPPPTDAKFRDLAIYVRPPKNLQPAREFLLPLEPGKFDLAASFLESGSPGATPAPSDQPQPPAAGEPAKQTEPAKQSMHVVARVKRNIPAAKKKVAEPANRREFTTDLLALLNSTYAPQPEVTLDKFKVTTKGRPTSSKKNEFRQYTLPPGPKTIQVYLYAPKGDPYEVALIFEYPSSEHGNLLGKIDLCLESFAVGNRAKAAFSGGVSEAPETGGAPAGGVAF